MSRGRRWLIVFALLGGNLVLSLLVLAALSPEQKAPSRELMTLYQRTIADAERLSPNRVTDRLFALNSNNRKLRWERRLGERWVRVVTWQSKQVADDDFRPDDPDQPIALGAQNLWVTLVPQVQEFCRMLPKDIDPAFRLKQYLGLNPNARYERFVELLVRPEHIFRPCPDPDPSDGRCELQMDLDIMPQVPGIDDYRLWFADLRRQSYQPLGAPWTRLGYTYDWIYGDWGIGASEYLLTPNAEYFVVAHHNTEDYCGYPTAAD